MDNQNLNAYNAYTDPAVSAQQPQTYTQPVQQAAKQQAVYTQPVQQPAYNQPVYDQSMSAMAPQQANYGQNTYYVYNGTPYMYSQSMADAQVRCPGKEITSMIFGINALVWGVLGDLFFWNPIISIVYGLIAVGCAIPALVLSKQVYEVATVTTKKVATGKKLAIAGIICGCAGLVITIIILIFVMIAGLGGAMLEMITQ